MSKYLLLSVFALAGLISGCASVTGSSTQNVTVQTLESTGKNLPGAVCELSNSKGKWFVTTPSSAMIHRSNDDMLIVCKKEGYEPGMSSSASTTKGEMFGNILAGGVIGAIIDHNSGAGYEYPDLIQVLMRAFSRTDQSASTKQAPPQEAVALPAAPTASTPAAAGDVSGSGPQIGDTWTYRYSDGYGRTETYKVRVISTSEGEIQDEIRIGRLSHALTFGSSLELVSRSISGLSLREFSPYLQSLGPAEYSVGWNASFKLFEGSKPFSARFVGTELVNVPAGSFEAKKLIIEGTQFVTTGPFPSLSRNFQMAVWYVPDVKRFVKMSISAPAMGGQSASIGAEKDVIELMETSLSMSSSIPAVSSSR